jgi:catechol 2,3-dioxygenase-like lactoylglutathione lyase family enzyme
MPGPPVARLTHVALPCSDVDKSIAWYEAFTPLRLLEKRDEPTGGACWLASPEKTDKPFILVLVTYPQYREKPRPILKPFAHLGVELPSREAVDEVAAKANEAGCLAWPTVDHPPPVGYVCAASDPDGNLVEFSHNQGVYDAFAQRWGLAPPR